MQGSTPVDCDVTPAAAFGPASLFLGLMAAVGFVPWLTWEMLSLMILGGGLAVVVGLVGVCYAGRGIGRRWIAVTGTVLGVLSVVWACVVVTPYLPLLGL